MRKLLFSLVLMLASLSISAQTVITHIVQRGETIESVAKQYGIDVSNIRQSNPATREYFYVGMKLTIPQITKAQDTQAQPQMQPQTQDTSHNNRVADSKSAITKNHLFTANNKEPKNRPSNIISDTGDFTSVGLTFGSDFSEIVGLSYGIQGQYFLRNGFGATIGVAANYGLESHSDLIFRLGPSYVYPITDKFYVMGTACYTLTMADYYGNTGAVSGVSLIPTVGVSFNHIKVGLNGDLRWRNGGGVGFGVFLSAVYSF